MHLPSLVARFEPKSSSWYVTCMLSCKWDTLPHNGTEVTGQWRTSKENPNRLTE
jgi:hypothetical protein